MAKSSYHTHDKYGRRYSSKKKRYTDAQRAAYWKKKYFGCQELYLTLKKSYTYRKGR